MNEDIGNDPIDYGSKIGTKKRLKLEAKADKRQQREVNKSNSKQDFI